MSGTLSQEWQPTSDRVNVLAVDSGCGSVRPAKWVAAEHTPKVWGLPLAVNRCTRGLIPYAAAQSR